MKHVALISKNADSPAKAESLLAKAAIIENVQQALVAIEMALGLTNKE